MESGASLAITRTKPTFKILRFFSVTSLAAILAAASVLMLAYRQVAITHMIALSEGDTSALALALFNSVRREFMRYLDDETVHHLHLPPDELQEAILEFASNTNVADVQMIDDEGIVVFATRADQVGSSLAANPGTRSVLKGQIFSRLAAPGSLWSLADAGESETITSFIPIQTEPEGRVLGAFVVDTDVAPLYEAIERTQYQVFVASGLVLLSLYGLLLASVRYAERRAKKEAEALLERSRALARLAEQLVGARESEKQRIAYELHEGIAQALCALKIQIEGLCAPAGRRSVPCSRLAETLVPTVQNLVQGVRDLAQEVRPSSLGDFGLLATLEWYFREVGRAHPSLTVRLETPLSEIEIPKPLKTVIYRVIEQITEPLVQEDNAKQLHIQLRRTSDKIVLKVADGVSVAALDAAKQAERRQHFVSLLGQIDVTGGSGKTLPNSRGGTTLQAEWPA